MHFPVLQICSHVFLYRYCIFTFQRPFITPVLGRPDRRTYYAHIFIVTYLYIVSQKDDYYFLFMVHKMLRPAVNHLQCCLTLSLTPTC